MVGTNDVNVVGKYYGTPVNYGMPTNGFTTTTTTVPFCGQSAPLAQPQYDNYQKEESNTGAVVGLGLLALGGIAACIPSCRKKAVELWRKGAQAIGKGKYDVNKFANTISAGTKNPAYKQQSRNLLTKFSGIIAEENTVSASKLIKSGKGKILYDVTVKNAKGEEKVVRQLFSGIATDTVNGNKVFTKYSNGVPTSIWTVAKDKSGTEYLKVTYFNDKGQKVAKSILHPNYYDHYSVRPDGKVVRNPIDAKVPEAPKTPTPEGVKPHPTVAPTTPTPEVPVAKMQYKLDGKVLSSSDLRRIAQQEGVSIPKNIKPEEIDKYIADQLSWYGIKSEAVKPRVVRPRAKAPVKNPTPTQYVEGKFGLDALRAKTQEGYGIDFQKAERAIIADARKKGITLTNPVIPAYNTSETARLDALKKQYIAEITKKAKEAKTVATASESLNPFFDRVNSYIPNPFIRIK